MARKISPEQLTEQDGELGVFKTIKTSNGREQRFETILNFNFDVVCRVSFGRGNGSGALYKIRVPGEEPRYNKMLLISCSYRLRRECFVTTGDSQSTRTFLRACNQVLATDLRCLLCDASFGKYTAIYRHCIYTST